jgi:hypothetical protein
MATTIGRVGSRLLWLAGAVVAMVFGSSGCGRQEPPALYGPPPAGKPDQPQVLADKQAEQLVADYLAPVAATEPAPQAKEAIAKSVKDFGSTDPKAREDAALAVVKHGTAALGALREAATSNDPEVASRAGTAVAAVEMAERAHKAEELKKLAGVAQAAVYRELARANAAASAADNLAAEAEKAGLSEKARKCKADAEAARERAVLLSGLLRRLLPEQSQPPPPPPYGMIRPMGGK